MHENVGGFDINALADLLCDMYDWQYIELDPQSVGWPVARRRRYTSFTLKARVRLSRHLSDLHGLLGLDVGQGAPLDF